MSDESVPRLAKSAIVAGVLSVLSVSSIVEASWAPGIRELTGLLGKHVSGGLVDYAGLVDDRELLERYLEIAASANPRDADAADALAFWINAYNASTLRLVLEHYPGIASVRDVQGFFKERSSRIAGELLSLDQIEQRALSFGDARVHFAVVCASVSCPPLRSEPYLGSRLEEQLEEQTLGFLADHERGAAFDEEGEVLSLSSIFKWYGGDFTGGSDVSAFLARGQLVDWVLPYLPAGTREAVAASPPGVRFLDYDWGLNECARDTDGSMSVPPCQ